MDRLLLALTIPVFFALIAMEWVVSRRRGREVFQFQDSLASLATGILQTVADFWVALWTLGSYAFVFEHARLQAWTVDSPWRWLLLFLAVDFLYYWFHRASHRVNVLWAAHGVHHQSEEYNLTTALRQSALQPVFSAVFYWPLALLGVPLEAVFLLFTVDVLYQFWIHTRLLPRLGPLEYIFNTPSNHRVHHAIDPQYIDKNYGGILIVWDRLFGTYEPEGIEPTYGTVKPLRSWNPLWANVVYWTDIWARARASSTWREKAFAWFAPPEWRSQAEGGPIAIPPVGERTRYQLKRIPAVERYVGAQYLWVVAVLLAMLLASEQVRPAQLAGLGVWVAAAIAVWGGLLERKAWAVPLEVGRLGLSVLLAMWLVAPYAWPAAIACVAVALVDGFFLARLWRLQRKAPA